METTKQTIVEPPVIDQVKAYAETRLKLAKYQAIEKGSSVIAEIVADVVMAFCFLLAFLFASITLACFLAVVLGSYWAGFGCVALLYLLIAIAVIMFKKSIEKPLINSIIKKFF
jgi:hypothetical protein